MLRADNPVFNEPIYPYQRHRDQDSSTPQRYPVVIVGAGPTGLIAAIDLAKSGIPVVVLDDNDKVCYGSRAICFAKRSLEILDRLGCGDRCVDKGVIWNKCRIFLREQQIYSFDMLPEPEHKRPAFINLQQYYFELFLVEHLYWLQEQGKPIEIRGKNKVIAADNKSDHVSIRVQTPEGEYLLEAGWLLACDGVNSVIREHLGFGFTGDSFGDYFLITDVVMQADFPSERWFWFDAPFNNGKSALMHKQPDNVWRIDLQLGSDIDCEQEQQPERVRSRLRAMLGKDTEFDLEWISTYHCRSHRMEKFRHHRIFFLGDAAHQIAPFGARGGNSGIQDADNLCWKLKLVIQELAPSSLLDSYSNERVQAAEDNICNSTRSACFITPKSDVSRSFREAVLTLAEHHPFARPLVNCGRLSVPYTYSLSPLSDADNYQQQLPDCSRPGAAAPDAALKDGSWLLENIGNVFVLLAINASAPQLQRIAGITVQILALSASSSLQQRYLEQAPAAYYLIRPDQHICARWLEFDLQALTVALLTATGNQHRIT